MNSNLKIYFDKDGKKISPQLDSKTKNFLIDIDGTITEDIPNEEPERMITCKPWTEARTIINNWYNEGHIITFFTSRTDETKDITLKWLKKHKFKFHSLLMNKPRGGNYHWIDNHIVRATRFKTKWSKLVKTNATVEVFDNDIKDK
ncbi:MAG: phosphoheptose isomerase [Flavobacteriales bacterium]|nr:phosphoheptose isomerase [Flavobacteriales bacterium]|tara:strand:+ start:456 stop:893 length:438 start_codon:yes stop_codon:yes gene_type:complete